jgi:hypothetical protein
MKWCHAFHFSYVSENAVTCYEKQKKMTDKQVSLTVCLKSQGKARQAFHKKLKFN